VLAKFFEVKDSIAYIRNPFPSSEEGKTRKRSDGELPAEAELLDRGYVVVVRYAKRETTFAEFQTLKYRCMAAFPDAKAESIFEDTYRALHSTFFSARQLATRYWKRQDRVAVGPAEQAKFQRHLEELNRHEGFGTWETIRMASGKSCKAFKRGWKS